MRWVERGADASARRGAAAEFARELNLAPAAASLLARRGVATLDEARRFLEPRLEDLHDPFLMLGMRAAVERLERAVAQREKILVYGDYDVDGTMATVILRTALQLCGGLCEHHVPHRLLEGYGMRDEVLERAAGEGVRLIVSVDTGIRAFAAAEAAKRLGLDLIVTDHHLPEGDNAPEALAVLNPNQADCGYPCKELCGAGVAFKLAQALLERAGRGRLVASFMKIAAIATVADVVPLVGENRILVRHGLEGLAQSSNPGLSSLLRLCQIEAGRAPSATEIAFRLAPRINAAGRMDVAEQVVELFTTRDAARAQELSARLDELNAQRQQEEARIVGEIEEQIASAGGVGALSSLVLAGEGWHRGVVGICASRVVERHGRPSLVVSLEGEEAHGSGRSIASFHLLEALESMPELFTRFGGHAHAVGFAMPSANVSELRRRLDEYASARLGPDDFEQELVYDGELALDDVTPELWRSLERMAPFGAGNPEPVFVARGLQLSSAPRILKQKHIKLSLEREGVYRRPIDALGWRMAEKFEREPAMQGDRLDAAFRIERNTHPDFGGGLQLVLKDFVVERRSH